MRNSPVKILFVAWICLAAGAVSAASRVFFDDFESGNTDKWQKDDYRNKCPVVLQSTDGVSGPFAGAYMASCNWNGTVAWNDPASFETLTLPSLASSNELFYRIRVRIDKDVDKTAGSAAKILRIFVPTAAVNDMNDAVRLSSGLTNEGQAGGNQMTTYWGGAGGDTTASSATWHRIEYYFNKTSGTVKVWHDGILVRNESGLAFNGTWWMPLYLVSNFADPHDAVNHVYFDDVEVFTEVGSGAVGLMSDGSIRAGQQPEPPEGLNAL
jgi:hypothetical protein